MKIKLSIDNLILLFFKIKQKEELMHALKACLLSKISKTIWILSDKERMKGFILA